VVSGFVRLSIQFWMSTIFQADLFLPSRNGGGNSRAGVNPAASVHWLRHAHASHAIDNGAPITLVSATLGHADLKATSVYAHARPGESSGRYLKTK
jgi:integrase